MLAKKIYLNGFGWKAQHAVVQVIMRIGRTVRPGMGRKMAPGLHEKKGLAHDHRAIESVQKAATLDYYQWAFSQGSDASEIAPERLYLGSPS